MGGGIPKPAQSLEAVRDDSNGPRKDGSNVVGPWKNLQGGGAVNVTLWKRELVGDRVDAEGPDRVSPSVGATDHRDDGEIWVRWRVGVSIGRGGDGLRRVPPHRSIHQESTEDHSGEGGLQACICILHGGVEDSGDNPDGALVGPRRSK